MSLGSRIYLYAYTHTCVCSYIGSHSLTSKVREGVCKCVCASCDFLQVQVVLSLFSFLISPCSKPAPPIRHHPSTHLPNFPFSISTDTYANLFAWNEQIPLKKGNYKYQNSHTHMSMCIRVCAIVIDVPIANL